MNSIQKQVEAVIEEAECASSKEEAARRFREAIRLAQSVPFDQLNADLAYALGYAWYNLPEETPERAKNVEKFLRRSVLKAPDNYYAALYLGHYYFDSKRFDDALSEFLKIPGHYFSKRDQAWRDLKRSELVLCCFLYTNQPDEVLAALENLIAESAKIPDVDRPVMSELKDALRNILGRITNRA